MIMANSKARPTVDELLEVLKRTNLPTVLVEGKDDIIFYRSIEEELRDLGIDMLPAGNKDAVLELRRRLREQNVSSPFAFVVDNDLWVHTGFPDSESFEDIITTDGYSIENDLFSDGQLLGLLNSDEKEKFERELSRFCRWYALAVHRHLREGPYAFRTHPGKVLDDEDHYCKTTALREGEQYPDELLKEMLEHFIRIVRGKSLFAVLHRQLSRAGRPVKFSERQLMAFGASRKGENFQRISKLVRARIQAQIG